MQIQVDDGILTAYEQFREGNPHKAKEILENELRKSLDNAEIIFLLKCAKYWIEAFNHQEKMSSKFQAGEYILGEWTSFIAFVGDAHKKFSQAIYATKRGVFTIALENYQRMVNERDKSLKAELLGRIGLCHKALGNYETAIRFLQDANSLQPNSATILAELGDCYALCGEEKTAKVLFREAFFISPQDVNDTFLESELYKTLKESTIKKGYTGQILKEWIPVYGVLFGVFNIKRELRALESGKLRQAVFSLEKELKEDNYENDLLVPKLINHYFWLIDHYITTTGERSKITEILLKIKLLDSDVHDLYTK